jgi:nicotinate-nucleotide pyrophosphorylase
MSDHDPIAAALAEDIGPGDITTEFFVLPNLQALGRIVARERAVVAVEQRPAARSSVRVDPKIHVQVLQPDDLR